MLYRSVCTNSFNTGVFPLYWRNERSQTIAGVCKADNQVNTERCQDAQYACLGFMIWNVPYLSALQRTVSTDKDNTGLFPLYWRNERTQTITGVWKADNQVNTEIS